jgi:hypothetical protein
MKKVIVFVLIFSLSLNFVYGKKPVIPAELRGTSSVQDVGFASVDVRNKSGVTALMEAAWKSTNPDVIERLVKLGANINAQNKNGLTALRGAETDLRIWTTS